MKSCNECGLRIKTSYAWQVDGEVVCSTCMRAIVPEWLWCLVDAAERVMEPICRAHAQAMRN